MAALLSPLGLEAVAAACARPATEASRLADLSALRRSFPEELARDALDQAHLRIRARAKFARADRMFFVREALEQATGEACARHRAARWAGRRRVADLGCGIGGDALALAAVAPVAGVERDPVRLAFADINVAAYEPTHPFEPIAADITTFDPAGCDGAFLDPARRVGGRRTLGVEDSEPPLSVVRALLPRVGGVAVKLAPGTDTAELVSYSGEVEFVSLNGELKECVLWLGDAATPGRRATALPSGATLFSPSRTPAFLPAIAEPVGWVLEPDAAVVRAGLVPELCAALGAAPVEDAFGYLTRRDRPPESPFAEAFELLAELPVRASDIKAAMRERGIGTVEIRKRGVDADADALPKAVRGTGPRRAILLLGRVAGAARALLVRRPEAG